MKLPTTGTLYVLGSTIIFAFVLLLVIRAFNLEGFQDAVAAAPAAAAVTAMTMVMDEEPVNKLVAECKTGAVTYNTKKGKIGGACLSKGSNIDKKGILKATNNHSKITLYIPIGYKFTLKNGDKEVAVYQNPDKDYVKRSMYEIKPKPDIAFDVIDVSIEDKPNLESCKIYYPCSPQELK